MKSRVSILCLCLLGLILIFTIHLGRPGNVRAQSGAPGATFDAQFFKALHWRNIGPNRGGRSIASAGAVGRPNEYYFGATGGGLWKTIDGGVVWTPIFDQVPTPTSSIGAIQVSISDPNTVYVGTGDVSMVGGSVNMGDGVYKSTDAGKTWRHVGLDETEHIGNMWVDPKNPDIVLVAALGKTYSKSEQRGVFKTTDGQRDVAQDILSRRGPGLET